MAYFATSIEARTASVDFQRNCLMSFMLCHAGQSLISCNPDHRWKMFLFGPISTFILITRGERLSLQWGSKSKFVASLVAEK